jgi:sugar phosphate isomerase/epimerase
MVNPIYSPGVMVREVRRPTFDDALERIHDMRFECVQFNLNVLGLATVPESLPSGKAGEIGATFWAYGLSVAAVSGTFNTAHPDDSVRKAGIAGIKILCESAEAMGTRVITLSTGTRDPENLWRAHPENDSDAAWTDIAGSMAKMIKIAEANSVILAFKPEATNEVNTIEKAVKLLDQIDSENLKVVLDPVNLLTADTITAQKDIFTNAFSLLSDRIALVHASDLTGWNDTGGTVKRAPAGKGLIDYPSFIKLLKRSVFQGPVILHGLEEADMPASRDMIADLLIKG